MSHPNQSAATGKPEKPDGNFPLTPRKDGRWSKKVHGKVYTFKGTAEEARDAYETLLLSFDEPDPAERQIRHLCEAFMCSKQTDLDAGQITGRTFKEYHAMCDIVVAHLGRLRPLDSLTIADAEALRARLIKGVGLKTQSNHILRTRSIFKYGIDYQLLTRPFHMWIKTVSRKKLRQYQSTRPSRMLAPDEIKRLLKAASVQLKACILCGVNLGFGNGDCGALTMQRLDLDNGWHSFARPKTGEPRRGKLWPETVQAIRVAYSQRPACKDPAHADLVFLTKYGQPWAKQDQKTSPLSTEFRKLAKEQEVYRPGVSFYSLRHVCETVAGGSKDQVATNYVMGHCDASMAGVYREHIEDDRLAAVADHVHRWLFGTPMGKGGRRLRVVG